MKYFLTLRNGDSLYFALRELIAHCLLPPTLTSF